MMNLPMLLEPLIVSEPAQLFERVKSSFDRLGYPELRCVACEAECSTIYLMGSLGSYYLKQVAQSIALKVPGVRHVVNDIKVATTSKEESPLWLR